MMLSLLGVTEGLVVVVAASVMISLALAPVFGLTTELIVGSAPPEKAGSASGISETGAELGGALGIAILGSIGAAVYRSQLGGTMPVSVPAKVAEGAFDTLGGAVGAAAELPANIGEALLLAAREAFLSGLHLVAMIAAIAAIAATLMVVFLLRNTPAKAPELEPEVH
jgi:DHA2 family multidrug resistance protein-like MFS transporter